MRYELVYYDDNYNYCKEETNNYVIYQMNDENTLMRRYYDTGNRDLFPNNEKWFQYSKTPEGCEHELTEEDAFLLCL
jgi:hypothetical protein